MKFCKPGWRRKAWHMIKSALPLPRTTQGDRYDKAQGGPPGAWNAAYGVNLVGTVWESSGVTNDTLISLDLEPDPWVEMQSHQLAQPAINCKLEVVKHVYVVGYPPFANFFRTDDTCPKVAERVKQLSRSASIPTRSYRCGERSGHHFAKGCRQRFNRSSQSRIRSGCSEKIGNTSAPQFSKVLS